MPWPRSMLDFSKMLRPDPIENIETKPHDPQKDYAELQMERNYWEAIQVSGDSSKELKQRAGKEIARISKELDRVGAIVSKLGYGPPKPTAVPSTTVQPLPEQVPPAPWTEPTPAGPQPKRKNPSILERPKRRISRPSSGTDSKSSD